MAGGRGWGAVAGLALAAVLLSVVNPALAVFVPLATLLLALPPRRPHLLLLGVLLAALPFMTPGRDMVWYAERGWVLILAAWFVMSVVVLPRAPFLSRALAAVVAALVTTALVLVATRHWSELDWEMGSRFRDQAGEWVARFSPSAELPGMDLAGAIYDAAALQAEIYPGMLALGSVAALAVAWWAHGRLATRTSRPLRKLREFRFRDELVWVFIAGLGLLVLPLGEWGVRTGSNVLVFMGGLYALRGLAVALALMGAPGPGGLLFGALLALLLYPLVMAATLLLGLTDTWLDLRSRKAADETG